MAKFYIVKYVEEVINDKYMTSSYRVKKEGGNVMVYYMVHVTPGCYSRGTEKLFF